MLPRPQVFSPIRYGSVFASILFAAGVLSNVATAQKVTSTNVTATFYDYDTATPPNMLLTRSDGAMTGATQATYVTNKTGINGTTDTLFFSNGGSWQLYLGNQTLRTIWITLSPVPGSPPGPLPDGYYWDSTEVFSQCWTWDASTNSYQKSGWLNVLPGSTNPHCSLGIDFASGGTRYQLRMDQPANAPGSGWAMVTCNSGANASTCNSWTVVPNPTLETTPNGDVKQPGVANLYKTTKSGPQLIGHYYNSFRITVTNP